MFAVFYVHANVVLIPFFLLQLTESSQNAKSKLQTKEIKRKEEGKGREKVQNPQVSFCVFVDFKDL